MRFDCIFMTGAVSYTLTSLAVVSSGCCECLTGTKLAQARKFNDPADPCKIMVSTDAIGMGLNL